MSPIIEINGLGKKYPIVHDKVQYGTLRDSLMGFVKNPFAKRQTHESFWALKDVNLSIEKGDIVGIIGKNGAGKSTLLKIIAGITKPTEGNVKLYGRISSLLEVGTGFHPELTGRENIFLNGVILGMTRKEVGRKFDEIVDFASIEKFLDTPVKHYSSGMYVRLAFAVAAHLEPDILIVDEVLAVGDMEFQKKCLGKMEDVSKKEGRTVIFVSHNMNAITSLVNSCVLIENGTIKDKSADVYEIVSQYTDSVLDKSSSSVAWERNGEKFNNNLFAPMRMYISDIHGTINTRVITQNQECYINIVGEVKNTNAKITLGYALYSENNTLLYWSYQTDKNKQNFLKKGIVIMKSRLPVELLNDGRFTLKLIGGVHNESWLFRPDSNGPSIHFNVIRIRDSYLYDNKRPGLLEPLIDWEINEL